MRPAILALALAATPAMGEDVAGEFDYYVLSLSWSASWCTLEGDARDSDQCDPRHDHGFTLHGLWPQYEDGYPEFCAGGRDPSRAETGGMTDIMGSGGLAWHQWNKHGRCTGLSGPDYLRLSRVAYERVERPEVLRQIPRPLSVAPPVVEAAFLEVNADMVADGITVTCREGLLHEVRICLTRELEPRACGADVIRDCPASAVEILPIR
ncbi:MAG: ribonuclease T2 [Pseudomonadota bacterium]